MRIKLPNYKSRLLEWFCLIYDNIFLKQYCSHLIKKQYNMEYEIDVLRTSLQILKTNSFKFPPHFSLFCNLIFYLIFKYVLIEFVEPNLMLKYTLILALLLRNSWADCLHRRKERKWLARDLLMNIREISLFQVRNIPLLELLCGLFIN